MKRGGRGGAGEWRKSQSKRIGGKENMNMTDKSNRCESNYWKRSLV